MNPLVRIAVIVATLFVMFLMTCVPPWREYHIQLRDPLPYVVEYSLLPTYAWYNNPPLSRGQGWGYEYLQSLLWTQLLIVGGVGACAAFGVRGLIVYSLTTTGFLIGGIVPRIIIPAPGPHEGWDSPLIFVIMTFTGLIGAGIGLTIAIGILASLPNRTKGKKRKQQTRLH